MPYSTTLEGPYCRHHGGYVRVRDTTTRTVPGGYFWKWNHTTKSDARSTVFVLMLLSKFSGIHSVFEHPYTGKVSCPRLLETRVGVATMDGTVLIVVYNVCEAFQVVLCSMEGTEHRRTYYGILLQLYHGTAIPWPGIPGTKTETSSRVVSQSTHALPCLLCRARLRYSSYSRLLE